MKKVFIPLLFSICLLCMTGCASTNGQIQTTDTPSNDATVMEKHIVSITADNYQKFLTVEKMSLMVVHHPLRITILEGRYHMRFMIM